LGSLESWERGGVGDEDAGVVNSPGQLKIMEGGMSSKLAGLGIPDQNESL